MPTRDEAWPAGTPSWVDLSADDSEGVDGMGTAAMLPEGTPSVWLTWFSVESCDDAASRVKELGGSVLMDPSDSPFGRMAVVTGAQGEAFGVIGLSEAQGDMPTAN